jgi:hypothetical protein
VRGLHEEQKNDDPGNERADARTTSYQTLPLPQPEYVDRLPEGGE